MAVELHGYGSQRSGESIDDVERVVLVADEGCSEAHGCGCFVGGSFLLQLTHAQELESPGWASDDARTELREDV